MSDSPVHGNIIARWTRTDAARYLGVSIATVRRNEGTVLHPHVDNAGVHWFDPAEVKALREERGLRPISKRHNEGVVAARVFELFRRGYDLRDVVVVAQVHPRIVRELYTEWTVSLKEGERQRQEDIVNEVTERQRGRLERDLRKFNRELKPSRG